MNSRIMKLTLGVLISFLASAAQAYDIDLYYAQLKNKFETANGVLDLQALKDTIQSNLKCEVIVLGETGHPEDFESFRIQKNTYRRLLSAAKPGVPPHGPLPGVPEKKDVWSQPIDIFEFLYLGTSYDFLSLPKPIIATSVDHIARLNRLLNTKISLSRCKTTMTMVMKEMPSQPELLTIQFKQSDSLILMAMNWKDHFEPLDCRADDCEKETKNVTTYGYCQPL